MMHRADRVHQVGLGRDPTGGEALERERWLKAHAAYQRVYKGVHMDMGLVDSAAVLLRRIRDDAKERREPW